MNASKTESLHSIKSNKSLHSQKKSRSDFLEEKPPAFEAYLPTVCQKFACPFSISVKRENQQDDFYKQLKKAEKPVRYKRITVKTPSAPGPVSEIKSQYADDTTGTSPSEVKMDDDIIDMTAYYDNVNNLSEIYLSKVLGVPRSLMQIIGYLSPLYENLTKITINRCKIDYYTIYELSKMLSMSSITDISLDGSPVSEGNYYVLLNKSQIKYLSLCRCNINDEVCKEIATRIHYMCPAEKTLLLLNLSSNHITDEGAKCLGQALRTNRRLRYLNLADNRISDDGAVCILDSLIEFRLTYDETMSKRKRRLEYLKAKKMCFMRFFNELEAKSSGECSQLSRKSVAKKKRPLGSSSKGNSRKDNIKKDDTIGDCFVKAELFANEMLGPFIDPFSPLNTIQKDGYCHCIGNMVLCYLNLSYNQLEYFSIQKLHAVLQYQKDAKRIDQTGLIKVVIEGNKIPISCVEYQKINELFRLAKSMHHFSGRLSNAGLRQKGRQTKISIVSQLTTSGKN